jgi:hypothetical protein
MAGFPPIRDYIEAALTAIQSVGTVHDYFRFIKGKVAIAAALNEGGILNAWFIRKVGEANTWEGPGVLLTTHIVHLLGVMELNDAIASEKVFLGVVADVLAALCIDYTYGGICFQLKAPFLKSHEPKGFAGTLAHQAIIELRLTERIDVS